MHEIPLLPVRMLNEHTYCPRLFALMWVHQEWADSADTVRGRTVHKRVDDPGGTYLPEGFEDGVEARSVLIADEELGLIAKIDLVETADGRAVPVDYKKGSMPACGDGPYDPELVQVCAQALLLRAHGYEVTEGALYYASSRWRQPVPITDELVALTLRQRDAARALAAEGTLPPPLVDSPRCDGCSLVGICLPDEQNRLTERTDRVRPLMPARDDAVTVFIQKHGVEIGKRGEEIAVYEYPDGEVDRIRLGETARLVLWGNISVSTPLLHELARRDIPVAFHSFSGWLQGIFTPASGKNVVARMAQHRAAADPSRALALARRFVVGKIRNCRVLLRRNGVDVPDEVLLRLRELADDAERAPDTASLMGTEGAAARMYFQCFQRMIKVEGSLRDTFSFERRNRRPPADPVNAMLSFAYACLAREATTAAHHVGLDPYVGFLHQPRFGRPALALDLMEELRPVIADSAVIGAINRGVVKDEDFVTARTGCSLTDAGRKRFVLAFEQRMDEEITHPAFGTRISWRRALEVQVRLLAKVLVGDLDRYPELRVR